MTSWKLGGNTAQLEERVAKIEGIIEQMSQRLNHIESRLTWMLGIIITMWITIILAIIFK